MLEQGKDIAFVCLGDVSVYSTFEYVADILRAQGVPVESVPGVTSFCAVASALGRSLTTDMKKPLHIIPGAFEDMDAALAMPVSGPRPCMPDFPTCFFRQIGNLQKTL